MPKMQLFAGDAVIAFFHLCEGGGWKEFVTIKGFTSYGVHFKERSWLHFATERNWYGFGYHNNGYLIYAKYAWQIPYACVFEKVRLEKFKEIQFVVTKAVEKKFDSRRAAMRFERLLYPLDFGYRARRSDGGL